MQNFFKVAKAFILSLIMAVSITGVAMAGSQDFVLRNNTGHDILVVNVSPSASNDWEEDIMGHDVLLNGEAVTVTFGKGDKTRYWDIRVEFVDGSEMSWTGIDLLSVGRISLMGDGSAYLD